jgi:hypothetical protein
VALQVKSGSFSLNNATGNQVVSWATGGNWPTSATPKLVLFLATGQTADGTAQHGIGMLGAAASSTQRWVLSQASDDAVAAVNSGQSARTNACIVLLSNGTPTVQAVADFVSFGAEQFTINVTTAPGVTGIQIGYIIFGGADITNVAVGSSTIPTVTGNQTISPAGFAGVTPDCLLTAVPYQPASPTESVHSHFGLGWATRVPSVSQGVAWMMEADTSASIDTQRGFLTNCCVGGAEAAITGHARGSLSSFGSGTAVVNWLDAAAAANNIWLYVAIAGGGWQCGVETEATTNTSKATFVPICTNQAPRGLLTIGSNGTADTASTDTANGDCLIGLGASDGATEFAVANIQVNGSATSSNSLAKRRLAATKALSLVKTPTTTSPWATVCGEADVTFQTGGFNAAWTGTDGTARRFLWLAVADTPTGPLRIQGASKEQVGGGNVSQAFAQNVTVGSTIIVAVATNLDSLAAATCADNLGNVYTRDRVASSAGTNAVIFSAPVTVGGACTVTVTATGTNDRSPAIAEWSGLASPAPDVGVVGTGTTTPYATGNTPTTSQADEVVILVASHDDSGSTIPTAAGYIIPADNLQAGTVNMPILMGYKIVSATGVQSASVAWTTATTAYVAMLQTYKVAGGGGPATQTLALAGAGSGAAAGVATALPGPVAMALAGVPGAEASGQSATLPAYTAPLAGAGSAEATGQAALSAVYTAALSGAASGERAGQATALPGAVALQPTGAASAESSGQAAVAVLTALALAGVASGAASGAPTVLPGSVTAALAGAGSGELAGQPAVGVFTFVALAGAGSGERAGPLVALPGALTLPLAGAGSGEAAGPALVSIGAVTLALAGVGTGERAGALLALPGVVALLPAGVASGEQAGQPALSAPAPALTVAPSGAASGERAGATIALPGVVLLTPAGVGSAERAGSATILPGGLVLPLTGTGSGEQRGAATLSTLVALALAGAGGGERAGIGVVLPGAATLGLSGAVSGEVAGVLTIGGIAIPFFVFVARPQHEGFGASGELFIFVGRPQGQEG